MAETMPAAGSSCCPAKKRRRAAATDVCAEKKVKGNCWERSGDEHVEAIRGMRRESSLRNQALMAMVDRIAAKQRSNQFNTMATKMFALFALLALCASSTTATHIPGHYFPSTMALGSINPCMQYCMTQQPFAVNPCMQYCMTQQPFAMGSFASPASMMMQQPWALPLQQYWSPMMMRSMMQLPQCHCGATSQIMQLQQLPFMAMPPMFFQQPFAGVPF
ncbi:hypothetical protein BAE44_0012905 [Dichanthelium oligosanthes]|uniref:Bifunctional inhibitor/plant lipid transfer protein/seed storage helical domain-containing protein n=1 Tax=Dichanthelium oligosanthes TaxID=888268 RepID=A0A1E5VLR7_9POAL|nr:hypothetical protein BAE44_0012905 [Dichanthelium oligosanthes]